MHPAYSVIVFTTASGAGFGLLAILGLAPLFGAPPVGLIGWIGFVLAFGLAVLGLLASTRHLRRPERAWRAFSQWRSSWLSREGVLAVVTLTLGGLYAAASLFLGWAPAALGALTALSAAATVYATAMIYAQLKTVRRWSQPTTAVCYLAFAAAGGALIWAALIASTTTVGLAMAALIAAWAAKIVWWRFGDDAAPISTPETATGLGHLGAVRLFESPHTGDNYLLQEMGYRVARKHAAKLRRIALGLGAGAPLVLAAVALTTTSWAPALLAVATIAHLAGVLVERWLFFAEAEHAVMNYYRRG